MKKKIVSMMMVSMMMLGMVACGSGDKNNSADTEGKDAYKVGIIQYVADASLNPIESNIEKDLAA